MLFKGILSWCDVTWKPRITLKNPTEVHRRLLSMSQQELQNHPEYQRRKSATMIGGEMWVTWLKLTNGCFFRGVGKYFTGTLPVWFLLVFSSTIVYVFKGAVSATPFFLFTSGDAIINLLEISAKNIFKNILSRLTVKGFWGEKTIDGLDGTRITNIIPKRRTFDGR